MATEPKKQPVKRKPLGDPIQWTDQELDAMAQVTPADIELAKEVWRANASPKYANLLDAMPDDDEQLPPAQPTEPPKEDKDAA
jgi:hypothetical protein